MKKEKVVLAIAKYPHNLVFFRLIRIVLIVSIVMFVFYTATQDTRDSIATVVISSKMKTFNSSGTIWRVTNSNKLEEWNSLETRDAILALTDANGNINNIATVKIKDFFFIGTIEYAGINRGTLIKLNNKMQGVLFYSEGKTGEIVSDANKIIDIANLCIWTKVR